MEEEKQLCYNPVRIIWLTPLNGGLGSGSQLRLPTTYKLGNWNTQAGGTPDLENRKRNGGTPPCSTAQPLHRPTTAVWTVLGILEMVEKAGVFFFLGGGEVVCWPRKTAS